MKPVLNRTGRERSDGQPRPHGLLAASVAALAIPVWGSLMDLRAEFGAVLWLFALVPVFLMAYHRGWPGAVAAGVIGVGTLVATEWTGAMADGSFARWPLLLAIMTALISIAVGIGWITEQLHRDRDRAERLALTDALTGIPNRRHALTVLEQEFAAARRGRPLALVMLDLDQFKSYNDLHGHAAGDEALRAFAAALAHTTRQMNISARYGGEEFVSILSDTNTDGALIFVERVRRCLAASVAHADITFSAGVAAYLPEMQGPEELIAAADAALYKAKAGGRNRSEVHEPPRVAVAE